MATRQEKWYSLVNLAYLGKSTVGGGGVLQWRNKKSLEEESVKISWKISSVLLPVRILSASSSMFTRFFFAMCPMIHLERQYCCVASSQRSDSGKILSKKTRDVLVNKTWKMSRDETNHHFSQLVKLSHIQGLHLFVNQCVISTQVG